MKSEMKGGGGIQISIKPNLILSHFSEGGRGNTFSFWIF